MINMGGQRLKIGGNWPLTSPYLQCCTQSLKYQQHFLNTILTSTCARIPTIIIFAPTIIFTFTLACYIIPFLFWITCCTIEFAFTKFAWNMFCHCFNFIFVCNHIKCVYFSFGTHNFGDKMLQLPVHLFKLIMNG